MDRLRGRRIVYCTEPNTTDRLNSGILKDLSGGELISYRMLFCNDIVTYKPAFKMHIMTNNAPRLDGSDQGVARRVRKVEYQSQYVEADKVDVAAHRYLKDPRVMLRAEQEPAVKMAFMRGLLAAYEHAFMFTMPQSVQASSSAYLQGNNVVLQFVMENLEVQVGGHVTFKELKDHKDLTGVRVFEGLGPLKEKLEKAMETPCIPQKRVPGVTIPKSNVFMGWSWRQRGDECGSDVDDTGLEPLRGD